MYPLSTQGYMTHSISGTGLPLELQVYCVDPDDMYDAVDITNQRYSWFCRRSNEDAIDFDNAPVIAIPTSGGKSL